MDKAYLGRRLAEFSPGIASQPITKVELLDENGDVVGVSGSDTGRTLTALQPDGTNAMAAAILKKVSGYKHIGYDGRKALLDPAVELGDAVTVDGFYLPLIALDVTFDPMLAPNISAPDADEIDDEYPYKSPTQRQIERNMAKARSLITKTSKEIMLKVEDINGKYTEVKTTVDGFTVTGPDGTTLIDGGKLKANSVTADQIDATNLKVAAANITGTLTANQIQASSISVGDLKDGSSYATKTYVNDNAGLSASEVDSAIETYIDETSITAEKLRGRYVQLLASSDRQVGQLGIEYTTTGYGVSIKTDYGGIQLIAGGNVYLAANSDNGGFVTVSNSYVSLGGGKLIIGSKMYGTSLPSNPQYGQLFFLKK